MKAEFRVELYRSGLFIVGWRWRVKAANNKIVATSGESYRNWSDCLSMAARLFRSNPAVSWPSHLEAAYQSRFAGAGA